VKLLREGDKGALPIRGPLGIWPFPILNTIILIVQVLVQAQVQASEGRKPRARTYNIVRDEHGRIISIEEIWVE
jgi:hypothetical protein